MIKTMRINNLYYYDYVKLTGPGDEELWIFMKKLTTLAEPFPKTTIKAY